MPLIGHAGRTPPFEPIDDDGRNMANGRFQSDIYTDKETNP